MLKYNKLIISAGSYRSGSTWMFNVIRCIFDSKNIDYESGFIHTQEVSLRKNLCILKVHEFQENLISGNNQVFTIIRKPLDIASSAVRIKMSLILDDDKKPNLKKVLNLLETTARQYKQWKPYSVLDIKYEEMILNKVQTINQISQVLKVKTDPLLIHNTVESIKPPKTKPDKKSLLWENHIGNNLKPEDVLDEKWIKIIKQKFEPVWENSV